MLFADTLYKNGEILTMDGDKPNYVEAVTVRNGKIQAVGSLESISQFKGDSTRVIDLNGKTMLPGFIDPHGHFMFALQMVKQVNVALPPVGKITDIPSLQAKLKQYQQDNKIPEGEWVVGWGYDNEGLAEQRHVLKTDLDAALPNHKVMIIHVSGHGAVLNSKAFEWAGIDASTPTPPGGVIARVEGSQEPAGLLMETAYLPVFSKMPQPSKSDMFALMDQAQQMYASEGYTHAQEGATHVKDMRFLQEAAAKGKIYLDIVSLPLFLEMDEWLNKPEFPFGEYTNKLKFQGVKFVQDGSPQGKTAYVSHPYLTGGPDGQENWKGEPTLPEAEFDTLVKRALDNKIQVFVHANGDATIDEVITAVEKAGITAKDDRRTTVIHSQFQRPEHLQKYKDLGMTPSYFTNHTFFWGDVHIKNIGKEAANFISPIKSATELGLIYSNHTDFNVTPLDPMFVMWTAMSRTSRTGQVIGAEQRVDAYTALQGLTTGPAYQVFEEDRKGMIKPGLLADFVILDKNPITVAAGDSMDKVKDIRVMETIKQDKLIYEAK
ncbi:conserved hypothetical protein [Shewanella violacea DSS12]|uniref:Amidohydrolase 3 domain-containing protein n=1 Tax=Shewanella violacea (strain JCM 10179 / CIP 106290 / LMG 19151 / DSS12) TaxID=637905 RepID=D4ZAR8_SHEVD|nr:conserved hypothetical protein [Shewanella violacea DSS12]